jgi:hypothetical protein
MNVQHYWLYQNETYIEAHERVLRESWILFDLLDDMEWNPKTPEEHESVVAQSTKSKNARRALRELREKLMAAYKEGK